MSQSDNTTGHQSEPPAVSPDGRFWWDGVHWEPFQSATTIHVAPAFAPSVRSRSPLAGVILSLLLAGAGHWYAGRVALGWIIVGGNALLFATVMVLDNWLVGQIWLVSVLVLYIYVAVNAHLSVKEWNAARGITS